ncbi:MAG: hypothetical protein IIC89_03620 [Chloroflexi bacterium]|nr:hypothetical protein [Chloroflexota bacterium]
MNILERETRRLAAQRGKPGPRFVRGLIWVIIGIFIISLLAFWAGIEMRPNSWGHY